MIFNLGLVLRVVIYGPMLIENVREPEVRRWRAAVRPHARGWCAACSNRNVTRTNVVDVLRGPRATEAPKQRRARRVMKGKVCPTAFSPTSEYSLNKTDSKNKVYGQRTTSRCAGHAMTALVQPSCSGDTRCSHALSRAISTWSVPTRRLCDVRNRLKPASNYKLRVLATINE